MVWYLINIGILIVIYLMPSRDTVLEDGYDLSKKHRKRICVISTILWVFLSGCRAMSVGADTKSYWYMFEAVKRMSWKQIWRDFGEGYLGDAEELRDPGFRVFLKLSEYISSDYRVLLFIIAIIFFVAMGCFLYKFSRNPYMSYLLFACLFYYFYALTGHRQTVATALVVMIGTFFIKKSKFIPFLIIIFIGSTIHLSCICFLPFYFIAKIPINKFTMSVYWVAIGGSFIFRYQLLDLLKSIVGYEQYNDTEGAGAGTFMILILLLALVVTVFQKKILRSQQKSVQITINALMTACFFIPLSLINESFMRVVHYFALFLMILLPELVLLFNKKSDKKFYNLFATIMLVVLFILTDPSYKFMWQQ